jgi:hypothetical protein
MIGSGKNIRSGISECRQVERLCKIRVGVEAGIGLGNDRGKGTLDDRTCPRINFLTAAVISYPFTCLGSAKFNSMKLINCKRIGLENPGLKDQVDLPIGLLGKTDIPLIPARIVRRNPRIGLSKEGEVANAVDHASGIANFRLIDRGLRPELFATALIILVRSGNNKWTCGITNGNQKLFLIISELEVFRAEIERIDIPAVEQVSGSC